MFSTMTGAALALAATMTLLASEAYAADPKAPAATAKSLYDEGVDLTAQQNFKDAEAKFLQAWALQRTYDIAANLGEVEMQLDRPADAAVYLTFALNNYPASGKADKREWIEKRLAEARAKVAAVTVSVNVPGAEVKINGKVAGKAPLEGEVFVAPGDCTIEVTAPEHVAAGRRVKVAAGASQKVQIDLAHVKPSLMVPALAVGGAGVAGLVAGVTLYLISGTDYEKARTLNEGIKKAGGTCVGASPHADCAALKSAAQESDALFGPGLGLLIGGAVLAAAGGAYVGYSLGPGAPPKAGAGPRVTAVGLRGTGVLLQGSF